MSRKAMELFFIVNYTTIHVGTIAGLLWHVTYKIKQKLWAQVWAVCRILKGYFEKCVSGVPIIVQLAKLHSKYS